MCFVRVGRRRRRVENQHVRGRGDAARATSRRRGCLATPCPPSYRRRRQQKSSPRRPRRGHSHVPASSTYPSSHALRCLPALLGAVAGQAAMLACKIDAGALPGHGKTSPSVPTIRPGAGGHRVRGPDRHARAAAVCDCRAETWPARRSSTGTCSASRCVRWAILAGAGSNRTIASFSPANARTRCGRRIASVTPSRLRRSGGRRRPARRVR
ncbi:MAG: hypothetical protein M0C28_24560 [Candidatus Moduliflexus flocculans]|nr:hypothetical protein [Candidatus Moduliflexus flocculans]